MSLSTMKKLWIGLAVLIVLSPLGLILPAHFKAGSAWGEWSAEEMNRLVGYMPLGLKKLADLWRAPVPDYALKGSEGNGISHLSLAYILSALAGVVIIIGVAFLIGKLLTRKGGR